MADDRINVRIAGDIAEFRNAMKAAGGELDTFARKGKDAEGAIGGLGKKADDAGRGTQTLTERTRAAYGITETLTRAQASQIRTLESGIVATQLSGRELAAHTALRRANTTADTEAGRIVTTLAQRHYDLTQATQVSTKATAGGVTQLGLARHEAINLGRQFQDVAVSLGSGQSIGTVLLQQGTQIADVFATSTGTVRGFLSQAATWAGRFATSTAGVVTGTLAIGAAAAYSAASWQQSQAEISRSLIGIGRQSGATAGDINRIVTDSAANTKLSTGEARDLAIALAQTGRIGVAQIESLTKRGHDFARVLGLELPQANKLLAESFADPAKGVDIIGDKLGGFTGRMRQEVKDLAQQFRFAEAQQAIERGMLPTLARAAEATSTLSKMGDATSKAFKEIGATMNRGLDRLTGNNPATERLAAAQGELNTLQATQVDRSGLGLGRTFFDARLERDIDAAKAKVAELRAEVDKVRGDNFAALGNAAAVAAEKIAPEIMQVRELKNAYEGMKAVAATPQAMSGLSTDQVAQVQRAVQLLGIQNSEVERLKASYGGVSLETAKTVDALRQQLPIASAVTGEQQIQAQYQVTIATAASRNQTLAEATMQAEAQRATSLAQVNAQAQATLLSMQNQRGVAEAVTGAEQIRAQAQATYNTLIQQSVDKKLASAIATEQEEQATARVNAQVENQIHALEQSTDLIKARQNGTEATVKAEQAYENAIRAGADAATAAALQSATLANERARANERAANQAAREAAEMDRIIAAAREKARIDAFVPSGIPYSELFTRKDGGKSQFNPAGYDFKTDTAQLMFAKQSYGPGGYAWQEGLGGGRGVPNAQGYEFQTDKYLSGGWESGNIVGAIDRLLNPSAMGRGGFGSGPGSTFGGGAIDQAALQTLDRLTNLLDNDQDKIVVLQKAIADLREKPLTIAREEAIKRLNEQLKQLTDATEKNTDAMTLRLDPLFSEGHDYIDKLRIGYYKAATGLTGVVGGDGGIDTNPVNLMLTRGERVQVDPAGEWGKNDYWRQAGASTANDNSRTTTTIVNQTINIRANESPQGRYIKRQVQQGFGRAVGL